MAELHTQNCVCSCYYAVSAALWWPWLGKTIHKLMVSSFFFFFCQTVPVSTTSSSTFSEGNKKEFILFFYLFIVTVINWGYRFICHFSFTKKYFFFSPGIIYKIYNVLMYKNNTSDKIWQHLKCAGASKLYSASSDLTCNKGLLRISLRQQVQWPTS